MQITEVTESLLKINQIKAALKAVLTAKGLNMKGVPFTEYANMIRLLRKPQ